MTYDAMTCFVEMKGEAALADLMHKSYKANKLKKKQVGKPGNRRGVQDERITERIERVKKIEGIFSKREVSEKLSISRGAADYLVRRMVEKNIARQVIRLGGEGELKYKLDIENAA